MSEPSLPMQNLCEKLAISKPRVQCFAASTWASTRSLGPLWRTARVLGEWQPEDTVLNSTQNDGLEPVLQEKCFGDKTERLDVRQRKGGIKDSLFFA